jgi:subtilisin family serine protease
MKPAAALVLAVAVMFALPVAASAQRLRPFQPPTSRASQAATVPGQVIAQFDAGVSASARNSARQAADVNVVKAMRRPGQQLLETKPGQTVDEAIRELERDPRVAFAQENFVYHAMAVPNDPLFGQLWAQLNSGQAVRGTPGFLGTAGVDTDAVPAWERATGSPNILVAVVDTGIAYDHPDLDGNIWINPNDPPGGGDQDGNGFVDDVHGADIVSGDGDPYDLNEHGTHVAGTIGAEGNNGIGVAGMNWAVRIMAVRVLNAAGSGTSQTVADGFDYAGDEGARIANASLGGTLQAADQAALDAVNAHRNTLYVVAAGNGGGDGIGDNNDALPQSPCNLPAANILCVAATTQSDARASFSNFGPTSVDMGAPGTNILSTVPAFDFQDDFEADNLGTKWVSEGTAAWGRQSGTSASGTFSVADSPAGNYAPNADTSLRTNRAVQVGGAACPISFETSLEVESDFDSLVVETSPSAGGPWTPRLGPLDGTTQGRWIPITIDDLPTATLFVRFHFRSDGTGQFNGVNLDKIRVGCVDPTPAYDGTEFAFFQGTSMATPEVAGAAALALSLAPSTSATALKNALMTSGDPVAALIGITVSGRRLNVANLLNTISPPTQTTPPANPVPTVPPVVTPPAAKTLASVKVDRCKQSGRGRTLQLKCRLRDSDALRSSTARIKKGRRTVATGKVKLSKGSLSVKLKRKLRKGRYTLILALRGTGGTKRTLNINFRI